MIAEKNNGKFESCEYKLMCWVKNTNDLYDIQSVASEVLFEHVSEKDTGKEILFGNANIFVSGKEIITIGFKNADADPDDVNKVLDLFDFNEETVH